MTTLRFLVGVLLVTLTCGSIGFGARQLRRRVLPAMTGPEGALATFVISATAVVVTSEVLGTIGVFNLAGVTIGFVAAGALLWVAGRTRSADSGATASASSRANDAGPTSVSTNPGSGGGPVEPRWSAVAAGFAVALTVGGWIVRTVGVQRGKVPGIDTIWYHLPLAARFVQTGHFGSIHYLDLDPATAFYPANNEIPHAIGMVLFGTDVLSPLVNLGWLFLALYAAWCIGRRHRIGHVTLAGMATLLATPIMVTTQPGGALNDIVGVALLACAIALVLPQHGQKRPLAADVVIALIIGLAIGTKFSFAIPALLLTFFVMANAPSGERARRLPAIAGAIVLTGGYWFVRNLVAVGNPLPSTGFGPLHLPSVTGPVPATTFARFLFNASAWRNYFIPQTVAETGVAGIATGAALIGVTVVAIKRRKPRTTWWLSIWAIGSLVGFIVTPQTLSYHGVPIYFYGKFRYVTPAAVIALMTLPLAWPKRRTDIMVLYVWAVVVCQFKSKIWPGVGGHTSDVVPTVVGAIVAAVLATGSAARSLSDRGPSRVSPRWLGAAAVVIVLAFTAFQYEDAPSKKYVDDPMVQEMAVWAYGKQDRRIVIAPSAYFVLSSTPHQEAIDSDRRLLVVQYPLYGKHLTNHVQMAVLRDGDHLSPPRTCTQWVSFLRSQRATEVVSMSATGDSAEHRNFTTWTDALPGAHTDFDVAVPKSKVGTHLLITTIDPKRLPAGC